MITQVVRCAVKLKYVTKVIALQPQEHAEDNGGQMPSPKWFGDRDMCGGRR